MVNEKEQKEFSKITNEEIKETYESMENTTSLNKPKPKKLTLKNDVIFQAFFSRKGNEKYLIDFLNALLKINIIKIDIREEVNLEKLSKEDYISETAIVLDKHREYEVLTGMKWYFIELPKFRKQN